jgi:hypothetical protein
MQATFFLKTRRYERLNDIKLRKIFQEILHRLVRSTVVFRAFKLNLGCRGFLQGVFPTLFSLTKYVLSYQTTLLGGAVGGLHDSPVRYSLLSLIRLCKSNIGSALWLVTFLLDRIGLAHFLPPSLKTGAPHSTLVPHLHRRLPSRQ